MTEKHNYFNLQERGLQKKQKQKKRKMVSGPAGGSRAFSGSSCAGLPFLSADHDEGSLIYGSENCSVMPCREFLFGTDTMGRDIFSMIWYGGRISLAIGLLSTLISTVIAVLFGAVSGCAPAWLDALLMRLTEIFLSVPNLLLVIFLLAAAGKSNVITISAVIGMTSWTSIYKGCADRSTADPEQ